MITRFFRVEIHPEYREEFEVKFRSLSVGALEAQDGCVSIEIGFPVESNPNEYAMVSKWQSKDKLVAFLGEDWHKAFIPEGMEKYAKQYSVHHYEV
ncbi:antibiotic biosynthesis monooxygenase family protein [Marinomonas transparens]|uniref:Antibiotic biosynthesis monooxygenase n=1 Tax=Marinomonas transparens TaxID=2795388 RepID=A0A934JPW4_9GAMM|nr:antibiotic biosynthesis monooxygenase family protein [Marinomonas transparens]MBJ7537914.1 antibiotic biosynthesis monooxygenase [Marinomonas transparens]